MDRSTALRIFGVSELAGENQLQAAYWRLRAHLERRLEQSYSNAEMAACRAELAELDVALDLAVGSRSAAARLRPTFEPAIGSSLRIPLPAAVGAGVLLLVAFVLAVRLGFVVLAPGSLLADLLGVGTDPTEAQLAQELEAGDAEAAEADGAEEVGEEAAEGTAKISVFGNLEGATLVVADITTREVALEGLANGTEYELPAGQYEVRVEHEKCFDVWSKDFDLASGDYREISARICADQAWLVVRSNVSGDRLEIDGQPLGSTSADEHPLAAGEHEVRVAKSGYGVWKGSVSLPAAQTITLRADLLPETNEPSDDARKPRPQQPTASAAPPPRPAGADAGSSRPSPEKLRATHKWHQTARQYLLSHYDHNRSDDFDSAEEIQSVPCEDWLGLEQAFDASRLQLSMTGFYGFDGTKWVDGAFGIRADMREIAYERLRQCGLR